MSGPSTVPAQKVEYPKGFNPRYKRTSVASESPENMKDIKLQTHEKPESSKQAIRGVVGKSFLFKHLDSSELNRCIDVMFEKKLSNGDLIIKQGDEGDNFYLVESGNLIVEKDGKKVQEVGPGRSFGEIALMYNVPRQASVKAVSDCVCWGMSRAAFRTILMRSAMQKRQKYEKFLSNVPILATMTAFERGMLADALESIEFPDQTAIIKQGDDGDFFYIIESGKCAVTKSKDDQPAKLMTTLTDGGYFGEIALLKNSKRAATVSSTGPVKCLRINREDFELLLGPCTEILQRNIDLYKTYEDMN